MRELSDLSDIAIECRSQRHAWQFVSDESLIYNGRRLSQYTQIDECMRGCGTRRTRIIDGDGNLVKTKGHSYDEKYLLGQRIDNADVRREAFSRRHREAPPQPSEPVKSGRKRRATKAS